MRIIKAMEDNYWISSLNLVEQVFTDHESRDEGQMVRELVPGGLDGIHGQVNYIMYETLR